MTRFCKTWLLNPANELNLTKSSYENALLALCEGNPFLLCGFPSQIPVTWGFGVFFICAWTKGGPNKWNTGDLRRHCAHYEITVMNAWRFADDIMKCVFQYITITVLTKSSIDKSVLVNLMAWHETYKPHKNKQANRMMTSSNGNIFRVTVPLCGEFTDHQWIPLTKASVAELWCFLWSAPV